MNLLKQIKYNLTGILFLAMAGAYGFLPKLVLAQTTANPKDDPLDPATVNCNNFKAEFKGLFDWVNPKYCTASGVAIFAIQTLINFSAVVSVLFIIIGGFFYLTSAGNEEQAEKGQKILTNAIIGLVVIILAGAIVRIISGTITASP
jgi:Type IV secretion system pilin